MIDFEVKRCSRRCKKTDAPFVPGESYFSVLVAEGAEIERHDYSVGAWQGPPESALGWWSSKMPMDGAAKPKLAPSEVALELFDRWADTPEMSDAVYVLSLFLVRKRLFRFADSPFDNAPTTPEVLRLFCPTRAAEYDVNVVEVSTERAAEIQEQFINLLYCDAA